MNKYKNNFYGKIIFILIKDNYHFQKNLLFLSEYFNKKNEKNIFNWLYGSGKNYYW